jgi:hypothetical protein
MTQAVRFSLQTANPSEVKIRQAEAYAYLETIWRSLRENTPVSLTPRQATALADELYRSWADSEATKRTATRTIWFGGKWTADTPMTLEQIQAA